MNDLRERLVRHPDDADLWLALAQQHFYLAGAGPKHYAEALACAEHALAMDSNAAVSFFTMAACVTLFGASSTALHLYEAGHARLGRSDPLIAICEAFAMLRMGQWEAGWRRYENRIKFNPDYHVQHLPMGMADLEGHPRVLIRPEDGDGDAMMFSRYAPILAEHLGRRCQVYLEAKPSTYSLFVLAFTKRLHVIDQLGAESLMRAHPDMPVIGMMSLPYILGMWEPIPYQHPFLPPRGGRRKGIGVCWAGGAVQGNAAALAADRRRSIPMPIFGPIVKAAGDDAVQLQRGPGFVPEDWLQTAHVMLRQCGLVIAVDTAVAHLSAALGIETWVLTRFDSCWRWGTEGQSSRWYPKNMRIFRQPAPGEWGPVIQEVLVALSER